MPILNVGGNQVTPLRLNADATLYNTSKITVFIGEDSNQPEIPIAPLTSFYVTKNKRYYINTQDNSVQRLTLILGQPGQVSLVTTPVQPPVETNAPIVVIFNQTIAGGATAFLSPPGGNRMPISQYPSVVGTLFAQATGAFGANPQYRFRAQWSNSNDNFDAQFTDDWTCATGAVSFVHNNRHDYYSECFDDTLTLSVTNYDTTSIVVTIGLFGSYRERSGSFMRGRYPDDLSNEALGLGSDNVLMSLQQAAIAAGAKGAAVQLPLYAGEVTVSGSLSGESSAGACPVTIQPLPTSLIAGKHLVPSNKAGILQPTPVKLPRRACLLVVDNTLGTAPVTPNILVTGANERP